MRNLIGSRQARHAACRQPRKAEAKCLGDWEGGGGSPDAGFVGVGFQRPLPFGRHGDQVVDDLVQMLTAPRRTPIVHLDDPLPAAATVDGTLAECPRDQIVEAVAHAWEEG